MHLRNLKQALNHGLILKKFFTEWLIFDQKASLKSKLRQKAKTIFEKDAFKLINNADFGKHCFSM